MDVVHILIASVLGWLIGTVIACVRSRRAFVRGDGVFRCRTRPWDAGPPPVTRRWSRQLGWACWRYDVLLVQCGLVYPRVVAFPVRFPESSIVSVPGHEVAGLGIDPVHIVVRCVDGSLVDVAASGADRMLLAGPFLAAAIPGLPKAPTEPRVPGR